MLDGDLLAYSSMAISLFSGLFLVAIHTHGRKANRTAACRRSRSRLKTFTTPSCKTRVIRRELYCSNPRPQRENCISLDYNVSSEATGIRRINFLRRNLPTGGRWTTSPFKGPNRSRGRTGRLRHARTSIALGMRDGLRDARPMVTEPP